MGSSTRYGFPWPEFGERADIPTDFQSLAEAVETSLAAVDDAVIAHGANHDSTYLRLSGGTVNGPTTFQDSVTVPTPSSGAHAVTKAYVDSATGGVQGQAVTVTYGSDEPAVANPTPKAGDIHCKYEA